MGERMRCSLVCAGVVAGLMACHAETAFGETEQVQAEWIWTREGNALVEAPSADRYFRRTFEAPEGFLGVWLEIAADNAYEAFLNGEPVGSGDNWETPGFHTLTKHAQAGSNILAVKCVNGGGPAGLLAAIRILPKTGSETLVTTGAAWKCTQAHYDDWTQADHTEVNWLDALSLGAAPMSPWDGVDLTRETFWLTVSPAVITPNGDGVSDTATIAFAYAHGHRGGVEADVRDPNGVVVDTFRAARQREGAFSWSGRYATGATMAPGVYTVEALAQSRGHEVVAAQTVTVAGREPWLEPKNTMKGVFPIGVWYDGRVEGINVPEGCTNVPAGLDAAAAYYERTFRDIRQRGLETVVIPNTPPEYRETLLDTADRCGVRVVLELAELAWIEFGGTLAVRHPRMERDEDTLERELRALVAPLKGHPSLLAYQLIDEPPAALFANWRRTNRILGALDPHHPAFSCLCSEGAVERAGEMDTQMIVFDRYPLGKRSQPGAYDFGDFVELLDRLNEQAQKNGVPFWMVLQTFASPAGARYPTAAELRLMTRLSLAHNAKGVFFFLYNSKTQTERLQGLVDTALNPAPLFDVVTELASELRRLRRLLLTLAPTENTTGGGTDGVDVRMLADADGTEYVFANNLDVLNPVQLVGVPEGGVVDVEDVLAEQSVGVDGGGTPRFTVNLPPGGGCLLKLTR